MKRVRAIWIAALVLCVLWGTAQQASAASVPMNCGDGTTVYIDIEVGSDTWRAALAAACAGHEAEQVGDEGEEPDPISTPQGHWEFVKLVCENQGICADYLTCPDGSSAREYVYINADGSRGETRTFCPGDPDIPPVPEVVPPTPGQIFTAFKELAPTDSRLTVQPPNGQTLVNFETIFSTKADAFTTEPFELVRGYTVQFDIFATAFYWNFGDGADLRTDSPGKAWESGDDVSTLITHVYTSTDPVKASVTTRWGANVRLNGGAPVAVEGTVDTTSEPVPLEILEAVPELVK